ncbi:uncharacterized protein TRIADDRAFT_56933 [Trichoplax adhaerens]|uniref:Fibronectin type-III domain-containing protein n=1 Tax=Trichoplax adhaerens TaxID=10228 RepID=B3RWY9_TRIAD|nr:hypothetical protein TRIADDRAFT_56933 [Trichoplax adhaerens]EDV25216.1 hypothetical protein TRIADDRAFT_56933 [Trichoplax adhaerens]|eukprot:XP_002113106.1 hypothetical protein TRIADDRAFT_56933 [Trichoplax adhaerens]
MGLTVFLLQSGYQTANRPPWNQWQNCPVNVNSNQGDSVKFELKQLGVVQYYYICNQVRNQRTWLISPYFGLNSAKEIYIKIRYTNTQVCPQNRFCASGLGIYASVLFDPIDGNICQTAVLKIFKGLVESQHQDRPIRTIPQPYKYRDTSNVSPQQTPIPFLIAREWRLANMHITIEDRGTCSEIEAVSVWYYACPLMNYPDAFFPRTVAPAAMNGSITVTGICSGSSTNLPYGLKTTAECQPNGKWANYVNNCPCNAGRERIFVSCQDCKFNYYKSLPSSGKCERCPNSMITIRKGARECVCLKNSILHISGECITMPVCKLFYLAVKNTSAILQFSRIEEQITRNMSFDLECFNCSLKDINFRRYTVYTANITLDKQLMVTNLKPATSYALRVVPWIHIVDGKQKKTPCETVIFRTLDGVPGPPTKVKTQSKKGNPLVHVSWKPPTLPNGAIRRYLIMFSLKEAFNATAEDLEKDVIVEVDHTVLFYNISTLPVRTVFHVTIRAATVHGTFGPPSVTRNVTVYERDRTTSSVIGSVTGGAVATGLGVFALKFGMMAKDGVSAGKIIAVVDKCNYT